MENQNNGLNYKSLDALEPVVNVVNEAALALNIKTRTIKTSAIPDVIGGAVGAGIGGIGSFAALYSLGTVGLSAAGITSALATAGLGAGMVTGMFVLAAPIAILACFGVFFTSKVRKKQLRQERERLYKEVLVKQEGIIKALKEERKSDKERIEYLEGINILLQQIIKELKSDIEKDKK